jgi:hypothetical protein
MYSAFGKTSIMDNKEGRKNTILSPEKKEVRQSVLVLDDV